ncbi:NUC189-domain-containing protein [Panus rudis PR-1116 ss-1]|nr:NUC189-domain-containing protein [Panus rudis PR-1116 ss-1]
MASNTPKSKKAKSRPPKSRPAATSAVSQLTVEDTPSQFTLSSFSPNGDLFAFVSLAVDKHRLRIYDTATDRSVAEYSLDSARITALGWTRNESSGEGEDGQRKKRKRRKYKGEGGDSTLPPQGLVLGLSNGSLLLFSPSHGKVIRTLSHPTSTAPIQCMSAPNDESTDSSEVWTSSADGVLRLWSLSKSELVSTWKTDERIPYSSLALRPSSTSDVDDSETTTQILAANHAIRLLSVAEDQEDARKPARIATFTGHASAVKSLLWDGPSRFLSVAEGDRFVQLWAVPEVSSSKTSEGEVIASIPLDSDVRSISLSIRSRVNTTESSTRHQTLLATSASGKISVLPLLSELPAQSAKGKQTVSTLSPKSTITLSSKASGNSAGTQILDATFAGDQDGKVKVAKLSGGVNLSFEVVDYLDPVGGFIPNVTISASEAGIGLVASDAGIQGAPTKRYTESTSVNVRSGIELGQDAAMDDLATGDIDGQLDANLAELSLGQRLTALTGVQDDAALRASSSDEEDAADRPRKPSTTKQVDISQPTVPASSLTRTLIQALHSSDAGLLETCLAHSNATLIQNTIRRLPPQLAVPLVTACVERLGRGKRAGRGKGGGAGAGSQRGTALIRWIRAVLIVHGGHLLTMPDLVARLSGLHATLTSRLTLQESLLSLSGRLDMVISQIEMRSSAAPAPLPLPSKSKGKRRPARHRPGAKYVEGESEEEEEDAEGMDVEVESGSEAGSIEDIELGGSEDEAEETGSEADEEEEEEEEELGEEDGEEDSEEEGDTKLNGFIDDEAEEFSGEDEDEESD